MNVGLLKKAMLGYGLACLMGSATVHATEYFVDGSCGNDSNTGLNNNCDDQNGDGPKKTIVAAIGINDTTGNHQVTVIPGIYEITTEIQVFKPVSISCLGATGSCVIEGADPDAQNYPDNPISTRGFYIKGDSVNEMDDPLKSQVTIDGFTI